MLSHIAVRNSNDMQQVQFFMLQNCNPDAARGAIAKNMDMAIHIIVDAAVKV